MCRSYCLGKSPGSPEISSGMDFLISPLFWSSTNRMSGPGKAEQNSDFIHSPIVAILSATSLVCPASHSRQVVSLSILTGLRSCKSYLSSLVGPKLLCSHLPQWPHPLRALLNANKVFLRPPFTQQMPGVVMSIGIFKYTSTNMAFFKYYHDITLLVFPLSLSLSLEQLLPTSVSPSLSCVPINSIATWHF